LNKGTLPVIARLQALRTAANVASGGARVIATDADPNPLAALLCEINETVLGRTLTFESAAGSDLSMEVSGRRVLRLTAATGLSGAEDLLAVEALDDEQKDSLIKLLQAAAATGHELRVRASPMTRAVDGVSVGIPVALLADLLLVDLNPLEGNATPAPIHKAEASDAPAAPLHLLAQVSDDTPAPEPEPDREIPPAPPAPTANEAQDLAAPPVGGPFLGAFARAFGSELVAWLIVGGEENGATDGPDEMVSHLKGFLDDEGDALNQQLDAISTGAENPVCIVLGATLVEGHNILCARMDSGILLGVIEGDAAKAVLRAWTSALHS
jgi:hypothetical protein